MHSCILHNLFWVYALGKIYKTISGQDGLQEIACKCVSNSIVCFGMEFCADHFERSLVAPIKFYRTAIPFERLKLVRNVAQAMD